MELVPMAMLLVALLVREYVYQRERDQMTAERRELLQRIQAPREIAYKEFQESLPPGASAEPIWSDEDVWKAMGNVPLKLVEEPSE